MTRFIFIAMQLVVLAAFAASPPLEDFCSSFDGKNCEISWEATNRLPVSVKTWKVVPTKFSSATVSNLLQIAGLKPDQQKRMDQSGVFAGKDVQSFGDRQGTRQLNLVPSQGFIVVNKRGAIAEIPKQSPVDVPDDEKALRLALGLVEKIGISRSELATNSDGRIQRSFLEGSVLHKDRGGQIVTNVTDREIDLRRQIVGIPVWGDAGIAAKFGNEGQLAYLAVTWRAVEADEDCSIPSAAEFLDLIKAGRALIRNEQAGQFKKLSVRMAGIYYWENSGSEPQSFIYPFAVLDAKPDSAGDNSVVQLFVPFAGH